MKTMNAALPSRFALRPSDWGERLVPAIAIGAGVVAIAMLANFSPHWVAAIGVALALFYALKRVTLHGGGMTAPTHRFLGYLFLWPGMNARTFLRDGGPKPEVPPRPNWRLRS
jgi:hypothetical protein